MEIFGVASAFCDICQNNLSSMLELDKVDSLSDFLLIARFDLMGFVFVDSVTDLLLKNFRISSVLLS